MKGKLHKPYLEPLERMSEQGQGAVEKLKIHLWKKLLNLEE